MNAQIEKKVTAAATTLTPAVYNELVAAARLRDIKLMKSDFSLQEIAFDHSAESKLMQNCEIERAEYDPEAELIAVWVGADATCKKKNKKVVSLRCKYLILYDVQGRPEDAAVAVFARRVARFAAYPYFRAHFAEVCSQAGLRLPPLPVIKETRLIPRDKPIPAANTKRLDAAETAPEGA